MSKLDLLAIGEAMAELRRDGPARSDTGFKVGFAGDTFNTAIYCRRAMGAGSSIGYFTRVGQDPLSTEFISMAERERLDTSFIALDQERLIGIYSVSTDETGERSFSYWRDNSAARQLFSHDEAAHYLPPARIVYLSGITLAILSPPALPGAGSWTGCPRFPKPGRHSLRLIPIIGPNSGKTLPRPGK